MIRQVQKYSFSNTISSFLDLVPGYKKVNVKSTKKRCKSFLQRYGDAIEAKIACDKDRHCFAIYNTLCKAKGYYDLCFKDELGETNTIFEGNTKWDKCIFQKGEYIISGVIIDILSFNSSTHR